MLEAGAAAPPGVQANRCSRSSEAADVNRFPQVQKVLDWCWTGPGWEADEPGGVFTNQVYFQKSHIRYFNLNRPTRTLQVPHRPPLKKEKKKDPGHPGKGVLGVGSGSQPSRRKTRVNEKKERKPGKREKSELRGCLAGQGGSGRPGRTRKDGSRTSAPKSCPPASSAQASCR